MKLTHLPRCLLIVFAGALLAFVLGGCAYDPFIPAIDKLDYRARAVSESDGGLRVSTSVLSADESLAVYGVPLADKGIQPVWIEVENRSDDAYWVLSPGLDPNFFPPSEAADFFAAKGDQTAMEQAFTERSFRNPVPPQRTVSGFVLTNLDKGLKMVQVDLVATGSRFKSFSFLNTVPGFRSDYNERRVFVRELYRPDQLVDIGNEEALRAALDAMPCCTSNKQGTRDGDPLNLVIVGGLRDAFPALVRRGWQPTEETWSGSVTRMIDSALAGERYPYAPVSPLYLYNRPQDFALQRARDNVHQRNHLRLWLSPLRYRGKKVWVGQISRDIGTRFTLHSPYLVTHKIDPNVDDARNALTEDMAYSQNLAAIGFVGGVGAAARDAPRQNLTGDPYYTDGGRVVLIFDTRPTSLDKIDFLPWEHGKGGFLKQFRRQETQQ